MTASLRASATFALVAPLRLAKRMPFHFGPSEIDRQFVDEPAIASKARFASHQAISSSRGKAGVGTQHNPHRRPAAAGVGNNLGEDAHIAEIATRAVSVTWLNTG
jgi:hypothetical protein